jgi:uncharacterized membrane protein YcaP (DUF421 family)
MDILMDSLKVIGRIVTILPFLLFLGLYMGKRSIGELPVFDFMVVLVLGSVVGADIADPQIDHIHTVVAMIAIGVLQKLLVTAKLRNRRLGKMMTFEPTAVVYKGEFLPENLRRINYSIDSILQMLREKDVFHVKDVGIAIVEADGKLSVSLIPEKQTVKVSDLNLSARQMDYEIPIILDGEIQTVILQRLKKDKDWLREELEKQQIRGESEIFYAGVNSKGELNLTLKGKGISGVPPIFH